MPKRVSAIVPILFLAALLGALLFFVRDYGQETARHFTEALARRLMEINIRVTINFRQKIQEKTAELSGIADLLARKGEVSRQTALEIQPLIRAHGLERYALLGPDGKGYTGEGEPVDWSGAADFRAALDGAAKMSASVREDGARLLTVAVPAKNRDGVKLVLMGDMDAAFLENSLETAAFNNNTCSAVFDSEGRALFWGMPPDKEPDWLFPMFQNEGVPESLVGTLRTLFAGHAGPSPVFFADSGHSMYLACSPLASCGWQVVSMLSREVVNTMVVRQQAIVTSLMWRVGALVALLLGFIIVMTLRWDRRIRLQQDDYRSIIASISGGVIKFYSLEGGFLFVSPNFLALLGYTNEEFRAAFNDCFADTVHEQDRENVLRAMRRQMEAGTPIDVEYRTRARDGRLIWLCHKGTLVSMPHERPYIQSIIFDITHNKDAAQAKRISDERNHFILEQHNIIIFEQNLTNGNFSCSPRWMQTFGKVFNLLEPDPDDVRIPVHREDRARLRAFQEDAREDLQGKKRAVELRLSDAGGQFHWYRIEVSNLTSAQGKAIYIIGIITDIDRQKMLEMRLRNQAVRDSATGMHNKVATEQAISRFLSMRATPLPDAYALFMIDFDNFKTINDHFGHAAGDKAIFSMAQIIRRNFRSSDIVGRVGGDEFLVFCTEKMPPNRIRQRAQTLVQELRTDCGDGEKRLTLTASVGVACCPHDGQTFAELYKHADAATYEAKRRGKNQCIFFMDMEEGRACDGAPEA